jgi:hypothetical protein
LFGRGFDSRQLHLVIEAKEQSQRINALALSLEKIRKILRIFEKEKKCRERKTGTGFVRAKDPLRTAPYTFLQIPLYLS